MTLGYRGPGDPGWFGAEWFGETVDQAAWVQTTVSITLVEKFNVPGVLESGACR